MFNYPSTSPKCSRVPLYYYLLTYSMLQSPSWEANWFAVSQEIPRISQNPNVHYRTHKRPPPVPILGQTNPIHIPTSHLLEIHPNIIHPSTPRSAHWSPSLRFPHQDPIYPLSLPIRATCPAHLILLDFITRTILGKEYKSFSSSLCNLLNYPVTSSLLGPNILLNTMFSKHPQLSFLPQCQRPSLTPILSAEHKIWEMKQKPWRRFKVVKNVSSFLIGSQCQRSWGLENSLTWQKWNTKTKRSNQDSSCAPRMHLPIQAVIILNKHRHKKAIPLHVWTPPEGSRRLRHPDFKTIGTWKW